MTAREKIDALIAKAERDASDNAERITEAQLIGIRTFGGLIILADAIDLVTERINARSDRLDEPSSKRTGVDAVDVSAQLADLTAEVRKLAKVLKKSAKKKK